MMNKIAGIVVLLMVSLFPLTAQSSYLDEEQLLAGASFHENAEVRAAMADAIRAPFFSLLTRQKEIHSQILSPVAVEFELRKSEESFYLLFKNELDYKYPVWGRGNYIIKRDLRSGAFLQVKIFLQNDENTYIRLYPLDEDRSTMELVLYGMTLYDGIVLPVSVEDLSLSPFARIVSLTRGTVRWEEILCDAGYPEWNDVRNLAAALKEDTRFLSEVDDAALNEEGLFSLIESGMPSGVDGGVNCSGFAKWAADGILLAGGAESLLSLEALKASTDAGERGGNPWSAAREDRDPYFGLDWCRNLAVSLREAEPGGRVDGPRDMDVRRVPFFTYKDNLGYELESLKTVLYLQAVKEPGRFYFGAVNSLFGEDPVLWQFHHIALFFPWFDENGDFHLEVLETGSVSSMENLKYRYPGSFVHLSKAKAEGVFVSPWTPEGEIY